MNTLPETVLADLKAAISYLVDRDEQRDFIEHLLDSNETVLTEEELDRLASRRSNDGTVVLAAIAREVDNPGQMHPYAVGSRLRRWLEDVAREKPGGR